MNCELLLLILVTHVRLLTFGMPLSGTEGGGFLGEGAGVHITAERAAGGGVGATVDDAARGASEEGVSGRRAEQHGRD